MPKEPSQCFLTLMRMGAPNGMPYYFAVLEALLEGRPERPPRARPPRARLAPQAGASSKEACALSKVVDEADGHSLWPAVATALAGILAPSVFMHRVRPLRSRIGSEGALELVAPDKLTAEWVDARLGRRIQEALELVVPEPPVWRVLA